MIAVIELMLTHIVFRCTFPNDGQANFRARSDDRVTACNLHSKRCKLTVSSSGKGDKLFLLSHRGAVSEYNIGKGRCWTRATGNEIT